MTRSVRRATWSGCALGQPSAGDVEGAGRRFPRRNPWSRLSPRARPTASAAVMESPHPLVVGREPRRDHLHERAVDDAMVGSAPLVQTTFRTPASWRRSMPASTSPSASPEARMGTRRAPRRSPSGPGRCRRRAPPARHHRTGRPRSAAARRPRRRSGARRCSGRLVPGRGPASTNTSASQASMSACSYSASSSCRGSGAGRTSASSSRPPERRSCT